VAGPRRKASVMSHPVVVTFLIMAIVGAMSIAAEVLKPLALSVLLSFALTPLATLLERRLRLPRAAAVVTTVLLALGTIGGIGYVVVEQLDVLAKRLPDVQPNIEKKLQIFHSDKKSGLAQGAKMLGEVAKKLDAPDARQTAEHVAGAAAVKPVPPGDQEAKGPPAGEAPAATETAESRPKGGPLDVRVVQQPSFRERLQGAVGPYLEFLGVGSFVLILVLFMLMNREDLRDRIVSLFGHSRVSLTTRTMDEIGQRISRYLATFALVNSGFGLVVGLGLKAIGLEYAVLWGCLAALMRFIPYVGPAVAFALPLIYSVAFFPGWVQPVMVFVLFAVIETALNSFLEPVIYGKTTGVSALGLLVAAMFWTWLWGLLGILLSTPLTVCLAVLGKYVPSLGVFATMLGEEADLEPEVRFYQRLVALDSDGAEQVLEEALKTTPRVEVFDAILVPAMSRAERDASAGNLEEQDLAFIWRVIGDMLDELEGTAEITLASVASANAASAADHSHAPAAALLGVSADDASDALVLRMLAQVLGASGLTMEVVTEAETPMQLAERVAKSDPPMVVLSHLPPEGLTAARYQVRRLRARFADLPIMVGRWGATGNTAAASERLTTMGATHVAVSLAGARDLILGKLAPAPAPAPGPASEPAPGGLVKVGP